MEREKTNHELARQRHRYRELAEQFADVPMHYLLQELIRDLEEQIAELDKWGRLSRQDRS